METQAALDAAEALPVSPLAGEANRLETRVAIEGTAAAELAGPHSLGKLIDWKLVNTMVVKPLRKVPTRWGS